MAMLVMVNLVLGSKVVLDTSKSWGKVVVTDNPTTIHPSSIMDLTTHTTIVILTKATKRITTVETVQVVIEEEVIITAIVTMALIVMVAISIKTNTILSTGDMEVPPTIWVTALINLATGVVMYLEVWIITICNKVIQDINLVMDILPEDLIRTILITNCHIRKEKQRPEIVVRITLGLPLVIQMYKNTNKFLHNNK